MTIRWLNPVDPVIAISGGNKKCGDLDQILQQHGFDSTMIYEQGLGSVRWDAERDLAIVPEIYGHGLDTLIPHPVRRVSFSQNPFLVDKYGIDPNRPHPFVCTEDLVAVMTESELTGKRIRELCPDLTVPIIRTHSSGNGRMGRDAGFRYGPWPRTRRILYFRYKNDGAWTGPDVLGPIFSALPIPPGWAIECLTGRTDEQIAQAMRESAIFMAPNRMEGMCAPTSEAMISGCVIVCWTGGGPDEYLVDRSVIAPQDDVALLREALVSTAESIDRDWMPWSAKTWEWSQWFQRTYSREGEIAEICRIMDKLHGKG